LTRHNLDERFALTRIGPVADDELHRAVPRMDGAGPVNEDGRVQTIEPDIAEMTLVDPVADRALAKAGCRQRVELAGAAVSAVAVEELVGAHAPFDHRHNRPPLVRKIPVMVLPTRLRGRHAKSPPEDLPQRRTTCWICAFADARLWFVRRAR